MKTLIATISAMVVVGCATTKQLEPPTNKAPDISIYDAVEKGNIEAVKQHIAAGIDVNAKGGLIGGTPLYGAVAFGNKEIVELLIANGADVNAKDRNGITPLDMATGFQQTSRNHLPTPQTRWQT